MEGKRSVNIRRAVGCVAEKPTHLEDDPDWHKRPGNICQVTLVATMDAMCCLPTQRTGCSHGCRGHGQYNCSRLLFDHNLLHLSNSRVHQNTLGSVSMGSTFSAAHYPALFRADHQTAERAPILLSLR